MKNEKIQTLFSGAGARALLHHFEKEGNDPQKPYWDYLSVEEGCFEPDGAWHTTLRRNGDEIAVMRFTEPTILRVELFAYGD